MAVSAPSDQPPPTSLPASILLDPLYDNNLFRATHSNTQHQQPPDDFPGALLPPVGPHNPHDFYKHLIQWDRENYNKASPLIAECIELEDLYICSDGAFWQDLRQGTHGWAFSTSTKHILWTGAGPTPGHPDAMTPY
jgi:hypothetical protein